MTHWFGFQVNHYINLVCLSYLDVDVGEINDVFQHKYTCRLVLLMLAILFRVLSRYTSIQITTMYRNEVNNNYKTGQATILIATYACCAFAVKIAINQE